MIHHILIFWGYDLVASIAFFLYDILLSELGGIKRYHVTASVLRYTLWYFAVTTWWQNKISCDSISIALYFIISCCHDLVAKKDIMWQHQYCVILYDILLSRLGGKIRYHVAASVLHATNCQTRPCNPKINSNCKVFEPKVCDCKEILATGVLPYHTLELYDSAE